MDFYRLFFGLFLSIFLLFSVSALDLVIPGTFSGNKLNAYPNSYLEVGFLKNYQGKNFFIDSIDCVNLDCGEVETRGPYYIINLSDIAIGDSKISLKYHFIGEIEPQEYTLEIFNSEDNLKILFFMEDNMNIFETKMAKVLVVNNSDVKLTGKIYSNYPNEIFNQIHFELEPKQKKEYETFFYANKPGIQDLIVYYDLFGEKQLTKKTIFVNSNIKDFLSLPKYSFFATNPIFYLYSSVSYILSILA